MASGAGRRPYASVISISPAADRSTRGIVGSHDRLNHKLGGHDADIEAVPDRMKNLRLLPVPGGALRIIPKSKK